MPLEIKTEIYSRVSGYFRPVDQWNKGKQEEFSNRKKLLYNKEDLNDSRIDEKGLSLIK